MSLFWRRNTRQCWILVYKYSSRQWDYYNSNWFWCSFRFVELIIRSSTFKSAIISDFDELKATSHLILIRIKLTNWSIWLTDCANLVSQKINKQSVWSSLLIVSLNNDERQLTNITCVPIVTKMAPQDCDNFQLFLKQAASVLDQIASISLPPQGPWLDRKVLEIGHCRARPHCRNAVKFRA